MKELQEKFREKYFIYLLAVGVLEIMREEFPYLILRESREFPKDAPLVLISFDIEYEGKLNYVISIICEDEDQIFVCDMVDEAQFVPLGKFSLQQTPEEFCSFVRDVIEKRKREYEREYEKVVIFNVD